jgi:hypothetical protein
MENFHHVGHWLQFWIEVENSHSPIPCFTKFLEGTNIIKVTYSLSNVCGLIMLDYITSRVE